MMVKCTYCGWIMPESRILSVTVYEDYGDVCCSKCPSCGRVEYDGMELFVEVTREECEAKGEMYIETEGR